MGVRFLIGTYDGYKDKVALIDSVTETAFGPMLEDEQEADRFLTYLTENGVRDARELKDPQLNDALMRFRAGRKH